MWKFPAPGAFFQSPGLRRRHRQERTDGGGKLPACAHGEAGREEGDQEAGTAPRSSARSGTARRQKQRRVLGPPYTQRAGTARAAQRSAAPPITQKVAAGAQKAQHQRLLTRQPKPLNARPNQEETDEHKADQHQRSRSAAAAEEEQKQGQRDRRTRRCTASWGRRWSRWSRAGPEIIGERIEQRDAALEPSGSR